MSRFSAAFADGSDDCGSCNRRTEPARQSAREARQVHWLALAIFAVDLLLYAFCLYGALHFADSWRGWCFGLAEGACIAMLFVVGHDACHGSFTASRTLNAWIGRVAFLPSLTPFRTWELGHNQTHHVYTNLKPLDYVWAPFSKTEFDRLPHWRRWLERVYRTRSGSGDSTMRSKSGGAVCSFLEAAAIGAIARSAPRTAWRFPRPP